MVVIQRNHRHTPGGVPCDRVVVVGFGGPAVVLRLAYELRSDETLEEVAARWATLTGDEVAT